MRARHAFKMAIMELFTVIILPFTHDWCCIKGGWHRLRKQKKRVRLYSRVTLSFLSFSCVHCSVIFADVAALKSHIQGSHCEIFYKCPICPMAFKSAPGTHSHAYTQHPGVKIGEPKWVFSYKFIELIKWCLCDVQFLFFFLIVLKVETIFFLRNHMVK